MGYGRLEGLVERGQTWIFIPRRKRNQVLSVRLLLVAMKRVRLNPLISHAHRQPPVPLYHYTSLETLEKITAKGEIWATDINFLNDKTEYINARTFIEKTLRERLDQKSETDAAVDLHLKAMDIRVRSGDVFVASFSTNGDSLPQWRGYGVNGHGVAIGFLPAALKSSILKISDVPPRGDPDDAPTDLSLVQCLYGV